MPGLNSYKKWDLFVEVFNEFKMSGDLCKDRQRLSIRYTNLIRKAKKENNPVRKRAMEDVAKIIKSMMS